MEPYYPVNDARNQELYQKYAALAEKEEKVIFGGRLGEYKYYDMDKVIEAALNQWEKMQTVGKRTVNGNQSKRTAHLTAVRFLTIL